VNRTDFLEAIGRESTALAQAATRAGLDAPVPSCPGWTVRDLAAHVGEVQQWARVTVERRATERISRRSLPEAPAGDQLLPWFRAQTAALVELLDRTDDATPVWSWTDDRTAHFWYRRQANEAAVHRWDAELAADEPEPVETRLAADGVDEFLTMLVFRTRDPVVGSGETIHLHATDTADASAGEWLVTLGPDRPVIERRHDKGDVAARGTASDLDLFLWGRVSSSALEVFGDAALLDRFQAAARS
jgi:uncharacterized protein (TIGR03083 family)